MIGPEHLVAEAVSENVFAGNPGRALPSPSRPSDRRRRRSHPCRPRRRLDRATLGGVTFAELAESGEVAIAGDVAQLAELESLLDTFDLWWNVVTPNQMADR